MNKVDNDNKDINQQDFPVLQLNDDGCSVVDLPESDHDQSDLTPQQSKLFKECEQTIEEGKETFLEVGKALLAIRKHRLYRQQFGSFARYCFVRWGFTSVHANRLMHFADVVEQIKPTGCVTPINEYQSRPLNGLERDEMVEVMKEAAKTAGDQPITSEQIKQAADKKKAAKKPIKRKAEVGDRKVEDNVIVINPEPAHPMALPEVLAKVKSAIAKARKLKQSEEVCADLREIEAAIQAHVEQQQQAIVA